MNGDPERTDEGDRPDAEDAEDSAGNGDGGDAATAPKPPYTLSDEGLGHQWFAVADDEIKQTFGSKLYDGLKQGASSWAARFSGPGLDGPSADPVISAVLLRRIAINDRWIANGLFPGRGELPGWAFGTAANSIVLGFTLAPGEESVPAEELDEDDEDRADAGPGRILYPTVEGGRYLAALFDTAEDPDRFVERLHPIGRQAVKTYQGALEEFIGYEVEADLLVPAIGDEGEPIFRRVHVSAERSEQELEVLRRPVEEVSRTIEIEGLLYEQNSLRTGFGIQRDNEQHVTGEYDLRVADKLGPAWNKRVWARIEEIGPREEWMPRAGRVRRVLQDVEALQPGESRLGT